MPRMPGVRFVVPRSFSRGRPLGPPRFVVIHYTAGSEGPTAAEDGVAYDQRRTDGTSAHFYCDRDSIIQCVDTNDRSHTALYHGNGWGIHIEQCGTVQTRAQWLDVASRPTIRNAAKIAAWALETHRIPLDRLIVREVRTGRGVCGHYDCTFGFPEDGGTHTDPGGQYPWDLLFADIRAELAPPPTPPVEEDDDMKATDMMVLKFINPVTGEPDQRTVSYSDYLSLDYQQQQGLLRQNDRLIALMSDDAAREASEAAKLDAALREIIDNTEPPA